MNINKILFLLLATSPALLATDPSEHREKTEQQQLDNAAQHLFRALDAGNLAVVKEYANTRTLKYELSKSKQTPLHCAIQGACDYGCIEYLLKHRADVNAQDRMGMSPLHWLMMRKAEDRTIQLLLDHGANIAIKDARKMTPLHSVSRSYYLTSLKVLLAHGAKQLLNAQDYEGDTPLHYAIRFYNSGADFSKNRIQISAKEATVEKADFIRFLLEHGADPSIKNIGGQSVYVIVNRTKNGFLKKLFKEHKKKQQQENPQITNPNGVKTADKKKRKRNECNATTLIKKRGGVNGAEPNRQHTESTVHLQSRVQQKKNGVQLPKAKDPKRIRLRLGDLLEPAHEATHNDQDGSDVSDLILHACVHAIQKGETSEC